MVGSRTAQFIATDDFTVADILMTHVLGAGTDESCKPYPNVLAYRALHRAPGMEEDVRRVLRASRSRLRAGAAAGDTEMH